MFPYNIRINLMCRSTHVMYNVRRWASKKYSKTLNLPKTPFPLSMKAGVVPQREKEIRKVCRNSACCALHSCIHLGMKTMAPRHV